MKVKSAIEGLKNFNPNAEIFITWFDKEEFMLELNEWANYEVEPISDREWLDVVNGTTNDDRIAEAITESMRYDFQKIIEKQNAKEVELLEKELWEK